MQERKEYKMTLTQQQAEKMQQLINMTSFANDVKFEEVAEVKEVEEIDEREETIKYYKCWAKCIDGCYEDCKQCEYNENMDTERVQEIALKHIQGYKNTIEWLGKEIEKLVIDEYDKAYRRALLDTMIHIEKEFDISEENK